MSLSFKIKRNGTSTLRAIYSTFPFPGIRSPIFILGCGRSGTTILGSSLAKHKDITYLNEPRNLWFSCYPETDIWTPKAFSRKGKLYLSESDVDQRKSKKISRLFRFETIISGKPVLIEKLPINNFRLNFIHRIFPDARFIHIYRNALEVADSISKKIERGNWFGPQSYKWDMLVDYAMNSDETAKLPKMCTTGFKKGLLEWRLSTEASVAFLCNLPDDVFTEISYAEFINDPVAIISQLLHFIGIDDDPQVSTFVSNNVFRRSNQSGQDRISHEIQLLGGKLFPLSMDGGRGLTRRSLELHSNSNG